MKRYNPNEMIDNLIRKEEMEQLYVDRMMECRAKIIKLQKENEFLRKRDNKLQMIEQMFKNKQVDLGDLVALVEGE